MFAYRRSIAITLVYRSLKVLSMATRTISQPLTMNAVLRRRLDEIRKRYVFTFVILSSMCKAFSGYLVYILPMTKGLFSVILDV